MPASAGPWPRSSLRPWWTRPTPRFAAPTKFIGAVYSREDAERLAVDRGWRIAADGAGWRRVVASPLPQRILEESAIRLLLDADTLVICGGVPVIQDSAGRLTGVEAVVDKDLTAAAIAVTMDADRMLLLTDVPAVMRDFGTADAVALDALSLSDVADLHLPAGSMGPKVRACARFTSVTGQPSSIGALADAAAVLSGAAGTTISPDPAGGPQPRMSVGARSER